MCLHNSHSGDKTLHTIAYTSVPLQEKKLVPISELSHIRAKNRFLL